MNWLTKTEGQVQSFNKMQSSLEEKKVVLEQFQEQLQTLFDWQRTLDTLNMHAQKLIETCADTRISNAVTQLTTKYNALLSLAKEIMRRLELHYQEHQQHNTLYSECQDWLDRIREKLNECEDIPRTVNEVQSRMNTVKTLRLSLEQGNNKLRYALELKEKVVLNTEANGAAKIEEDTENLKQEYEKCIVDITEIRQKLQNRLIELEEIFKLYNMVVEWTAEAKTKISENDTLFNDLSEKRAILEKIRSVQREAHSYNSILDEIKNKLSTNTNLDAENFKSGLLNYENILTEITRLIDTLENHVNNHEKYKQAYVEVLDWMQSLRVEINQYSDSHGEKNVALERIAKLKEIELSYSEGKLLKENAVELSKNVIETSAPEGQDMIRQELSQLQYDWDELQNLSRTVTDTLNECLLSWNNFINKSDDIIALIEEFKKKIKSDSEIETMPPDELIASKVIFVDFILKYFCKSFL